MNPNMNPNKELEQENNRPDPNIIRSYETLIGRGMNFDDALEVTNRNIMDAHEKKRALRRGVENAK